MLGKSPIKWRQRPDMANAVDWDVKHQFKQINKELLHANKQKNSDHTTIFHAAG